MVAVSQAPSPGSNPNSPLPVNAMVNQYFTIKADRAETQLIHRLRKAIRTVIMTQHSTDKSQDGFNLINATRPLSWVFKHVLALELLRLSK